MTDSFILGLSSGSACLVTCGIVMFPYLMAGEKGSGKIVADLSVFLLTRLTVYCLLATVAFYFGNAVFSSATVRNIIPGSLYIVFAVMLIWYSIDKNRKKECPALMVTKIENKKLVPLFLGIVNSIGFCPALLIILTKSASEGSVAGSFSSILAFFAGSSLWFFPLPLIGQLRKGEVVKTIGILATGVAGTIFIIKGISMLIGGLING